MCHKPLKGAKFQVVPLLRPDLTLTVGPECFRKEKKARRQMQERYTSEQLEALRSILIRLPHTNDGTY